MSGVVWALVAAVAFAVTQIFNRKSNQLIDAYRTAFGLLATAAVVLIVRMLVTGEFALLAEAPVSSLVYFVLATFIHYVGGWTLIALSQQRIGVARSKALVGAAPLVGAILAAFVLDETFALPIAAGVMIAVVGVWLVSMSSYRSVRGIRWSKPWYALTRLITMGWPPESSTAAVSLPVSCSLPQLRTRSAISSACRRVSMWILSRDVVTGATHPGVDGWFLHQHQGRRECLPRRCGRVRP